MSLNKKISKKKIIIYSLLIAIMVIGNVIIYLRSSGNDQAADELIELAAQPAAENQAITNTVKQSKQIKAIVENNLFITLQKIGDWPIQPKNVGKSDPFAPFFKHP